MEPNLPEQAQCPSPAEPLDLHPINRIAYSLFPTQFFCVKRLVNIEDLTPKPNLSNAVILDNFVELYINPTSLQYPLIDSILNFGDRLSDVRMSFGKFEKIPEEEIYTGQLTGDLQKLLKVHEMGLYQPRFEQGSYRGGKRLLFRQQGFAEAWSKALREALKGVQFHSINSVFRYNCFEPIDEPFYQHYDIPYVDMTRKVISKYTIIIYLTGGQSDTPVLQIGSTKFSKISAGQCIIFDHKYSHKGSPYKSGNKLFLRSELIFQYCSQPALFSQKAAEWFNRACYLTKSSLIDPALKSYSNRCFQQYCRNRYKLSGDSPHLFIHKRPTIFANDCGVQNLEYITDGNDYYFSDKGRKEIKAGVVIWDYFASGAAAGCVVDKYYIQEGMDYEGMFDGYLSGYSPDAAQIPELCSLRILQNNQLTLSGCRLPKNLYQPYCNRQNSRPFKQYYREVFQALSSSTSTSSLQILQNNLYTFNLDDMTFQDDLIYFNETSSLRKFNFASCECDPRFREYIELYYGENAARKQYGLPYIRVRKVKNMTVLNIDVFRNGYCTLEADKARVDFKTEVKVGDTEPR